MVTLVHPSVAFQGWFFKYHWNNPASIGHFTVDEQESTRHSHSTSMLYGERSFNSLRSTSRTSTLAYMC